jgi:hypothetical protein
VCFCSGGHIHTVQLNTFFLFRYLTKYLAHKTVSHFVVVVSEPRKEAWNIAISCVYHSIACGNEKSTRSVQRYIKPRFRAFMRVVCVLELVLSTFPSCMILVAFSYRSIKPTWNHMQEERLLAKRYTELIPQARFSFACTERRPCTAYDNYE